MAAFDDLMAISLFPVIARTEALNSFKFMHDRLAVGLETGQVVGATAYKSGVGLAPRSSLKKSFELAQSDRATRLI